MRVVVHACEENHAFVDLWSIKIACVGWTSHQCKVSSMHPMSIGWDHHMNSPQSPKHSAPPAAEHAAHSGSGRVHPPCAHQGEGQSSEGHLCAWRGRLGRLLALQLLYQRQCGELVRGKKWKLHCPLLLLLLGHCCCCCRAGQRHLAVAVHVHVCERVFVQFIFILTSHV